MDRLFYPDDDTGQFVIATVSPMPNVDRNHRMPPTRICTLDVKNNKLPIGHAHPFSSLLKGRTR